jgi:multidrug resistance efflux pump
MNPTIETGRRATLEEATEMLPKDLPPWIARSIAWLLIGLAATALLASVIVRVPETVLCRFVLVPKDGADPIQSPNLAVISEVRATEGGQVAAGAELFVLRSDEIVNFRTQLGTLTEDLHARQENAARLESSYLAQLEMKNSEIAQMEREMKFREKHAETNRDLVARLEKLAARGGFSQVELIQHQLHLAESEKDLNVAQKSYDQIILSRQRLETERARQRVEERADLEKFNVRIAALQSQLQNVTGNLLSIRAPYDAVVISLAQRNAGAVVQAGQELCQLARIDATPRARLYVKEQGLPRLSLKQDARLFFDAFPYQRYGTVKGALEWVSPAAVATPEGAQFIALVSLKQNQIEVGGEPRPLRVGMKGEAHIFVGSRLLIEYAFEPIRQLRENLRR